ncbi:Hypothetical predicted protein [Cloeon dipterum]|uniref:DDE-1 domain-containing protein n=1 Tax=Cloeon dipterum TaxID=197152 RepID=A0A8S1CYK7_9INSE|nr:Hypothetical predicted protein [Cloeon dipterum]
MKTIIPDNVGHQRNEPGFLLNKVQVKAVAKKVLVDAYEGHANKREVQQQLKVTDEWFIYFADKYPSVKENLVSGKHGKSSQEKSICTQEEVLRWHGNLQKHIQTSFDEELDADRVFLATVDSFLFRDRIGKYVLQGMRGIDDFSHIKRGRSHENLSSITTFSAAGRLVPVMLTFKSNRVSPLFKDSLPKEWSIETNASGWVDTNSLIFFMNKFIYWLSKNKVKLPVVFILISENLYMHIDVTEFCEKNGIILCCLPKNIYDTLVPEGNDVNVVSKIREDLKSLDAVTRLNFSGHYSGILEGIPKSTFMETFSRCGLFPLEADSLDFSRCDVDLQGELTPAEQSLDDLEKVLPQKTLLQFQNNYPYGIWLNHSLNSSLFNAWLKLKQKARGVSKKDIDDVYDEEFTDEIAEYLEVDAGPHPPTPEPDTSAAIADEQPDLLSSQHEHTIHISESDVAVASIQHLNSDNMHDTIAIALANMGDLDFVKTDKRMADENDSPVPLKITRCSSPMSETNAEGLGVITSLMQNNTTQLKCHSSSMPMNPNMPRTACKIISAELAEASVDRRVAAGVSMKAKLPASVLEKLKSNATPNSPRKKR